MTVDTGTNTGVSPLSNQTLFPLLNSTQQ